MNDRYDVSKEMRNEKIVYGFVVFVLGFFAGIVWAGVIYLLVS